MHDSRRKLAGCAGGSSLKVISTDKHIVNIWDASTAQNMTSLQPQEPGINDVLHWKDSGLIMLGLDSPRIQARHSFCCFTDL